MTSQIRGSGFQERFLTRSDQKAHVMVRDLWKESRLLVAFPAGNIAAGLWVDGSGTGSHLIGADWMPEKPALSAPGHQTVVVRWKLGSTPCLLRRVLFHNIRTIRAHVQGYAPGQRAVIEDSLDLIEGASQTLRESLASKGVSPTVLRNWLKTQATPDMHSDHRLVYARHTLGTQYRLELVILIKNGRYHLTTADPEVIQLKPTGSSPMELLVTVTSSRPPPPAIPPEEILSSRGQRALRMLRQRDAASAGRVDQALAGVSFLASHEGLMAGSWRFLTYFGRDSLIFLLLTAPYLSDTVFNHGLGSVLRRINRNGRVAHEESVGEHATLELLGEVSRLKGAGASDENLIEAIGQFGSSRHDYHMVDTEFMVPLALSSMARYHTQSARLLAHRFEPELKRLLTRIGSALRREPPGVKIGENMKVGDWRDSNEGLSGGVYPASINACLIPSCLMAIEDLIRQDVIRSWPDLNHLKSAWTREHDRYKFDVIPTVETQRTMLGVDQRRTGSDAVGLAGIISSDRLEGQFSALALSAEDDGTLLKVMHTDGLLLLLGPALPAVDLEAALGPLLNPFPVGLDTRAGPLVASALMEPAAQETFTRSNYHGLVVWTWPMVLARRAVAILETWGQKDLSNRLATVVAGWGPPSIEPEELWTVEWNDRQSAWTRKPFGISSGDATESNSLQLWSLASLASALEEAEKSP